MKSRINAAVVLLLFVAVSRVFASDFGGLQTMNAADIGILPAEDGLLPASWNFQAGTPVLAEGNIVDMGSKIIIPAHDVADSPAAVKQVPARGGAGLAGLSKSYFNASIRTRVRRVLLLNSRSGRYPSIYAAMLGKWDTGIAIKQPDPGQDFDYCANNPDIVAFNPRGSNNIYMCALLTEKMDDLATLQTLIHETAHVAGYYNECDATALEVGAMMNAGLAYFKNGYFAACGF